MCLASPESSTWHCRGPWPWSSARRTQASVLDACSARAAGSSPRGHHVGARAEGPSVRSMSCWGRAGGSLCQPAAALLKQFLPRHPAGTVEQPQKDGAPSGLPRWALWAADAASWRQCGRAVRPWVVGPDWSPVPVPPLLADLLASSALDINSSCLLVFVKVNE